MLRVGLTGGIGSGKSTVARVFECLGVPVYYADDAAKRLVEEEAVLRRRITALLGAAAYTPQGRYDRPAVAAAVFGNPSLLAALNALVHPAVEADSDRWFARHGTLPYAVKEAALLLESGSAARLDFLIGVSAPEETRLRRAARRDGLSDDAVRARMARQMPEEEKISRCDALVTNDDVQAIIPQVLSLHKRLLDAARKSQVDGPEPSA